MMIDLEEIKEVYECTENDNVICNNEGEITISVPEIEENFTGSVAGVYDMLDALHVVRCTNCIHWLMGECMNFYDETQAQYKKKTDKNYYCGDGLNKWVDRKK